MSEFIEKEENVQKINVPTRPKTENKRFFWLFFSLFMIKN